ncbi:MAG: hypothetical protein COZ69_16080 [Deltaproteobacteria bacterium CG_4_8_14_3_um_filter_45_9]|nr:MAG: hypothetical protein COZ69_16080 [Deltaproteobacteria bacterium CG_4_8_14_3_um_filter_45_9]
MKKILIKPMIKIPKELLWDYKEAPKDPLWNLKRIADFFPSYGRERETVRALYKNLKKLKVDETTKLLIKEYKNAWEERDERDRV